MTLTFLATSDNAHPPERRILQHPSGKAGPRRGAGPAPFAPPLLGRQRVSHGRVGVAGLQRGLVAKGHGHQQCAGRPGCHAADRAPKDQPRGAWPWPAAAVPPCSGGQPAPHCPGRRGMPGPATAVRAEHVVTGTQSVLKSAVPSRTRWDTGSGRGDRLPLLHRGSDPGLPAGRIARQGHRVLRPRSMPPARAPGPPLDATAPDSAWTHRSGAGSSPAVDHREATKSPLSPGPHASPTSPRGQAPCGHLEPVLVAEGAGRGSPPGLGPFLRPQWASNESTGVVGSLPLPMPVPLSLQLRLEIREVHPFPGCRPPTPRGLKSSRSWCPGLCLESQLLPHGLVTCPDRCCSITCAPVWGLSTPQSRKSGLAWASLGEGSAARGLLGTPVGRAWPRHSQPPSPASPPLPSSLRSPRVPPPRPPSPLSAQGARAVAMCF